MTTEVNKENRMWSPTFRLEMAGERAMLREAVAAVTTLVRSLAGVRSDVAFKRTFLSEQPVTEAAFKRQNVDVDFGVNVARVLHSTSMCWVKRRLLR